MKVTLLGLEFGNSNMGCVALSYSFPNLIYKIAGEKSVKCEFEAVVFDAFEPIQIGDTYVRNRLIHVKSFSFWHELRKCFSDSDLIVDFSGGDSFSDIYGIKRFLIASYIKFLAVKSGTPVLLGPQTYGPFSNRWCEKIAGYLIRKCRWVFARDEISYEYAQRISGREVCLTTDVAFALPFTRQKIGKEGKIKVGINPSGLLWNGGYSHAKVPLSVDYKEYLFSLVDKLIEAGKYEIYLIPHVGTVDCSGSESDYAACMTIKSEFPDCIVIDSIHTPMDAKDIISSMDVFVGARMHATIGAFSSGVATIPFSYSRKFEGLYEGLNYHYIIEARSITTEEALSKSLQWISDYKPLKDAVDSSMKVVQEKQSIFEFKMREVINDIC